LAAPTLARAQVGYLPDKSPYKDLVYKQEFTAFTGWYVASKDPAGVAPQSGPAIGLRYEVRVGGPAEFTVRLTKVASKRTILDPSQPANLRNLGTKDWPLYVSDLSLSLNLSGQKSLRSLVPVLNAGIGIAKDFKGADPGGFRVGTQFAFSFGAGVRWVPGGHWQMRADLGDFLYQISYPDSYRVLASDNTSVIGDNVASGVWKHNAMLTVGVSYLFYK
jgi:hypothetical protein